MYNTNVGNFTPSKYNFMYIANIISFSVQQHCCILIYSWTPSCECRLSVDDINTNRLLRHSHKYICILTHVHKGIIYKYISKKFQTSDSEEMYTVHTTVISETLQVDIFSFILQLAAH